jgi:hypothetical protein
VVTPAQRGRFREAAHPREVAGFLPGGSPDHFCRESSASLRGHFGAASNIPRGAPVTGYIAGDLAHSLIQAREKRQPEKPEKYVRLTRPIAVNVQQGGCDAPNPTGGRGVRADPAARPSL